MVNATLCAGNDICQRILLVIKLILAILIPPFAVLVDQGRGLDLELNIMLTILGYVPGVVHAIWVVFHRRLPVSDEGIAADPSQRIKTAYRNYTVAYLILMVIFVILGTLLVVMTESSVAGPDIAYSGLFLISFGFISFISTSIFGCIIGCYYRRVRTTVNLPRQPAVPCYIISNSNPSISAIHQVTSDRTQPPEYFQSPFDDPPPSYASVWEAPPQLDQLPSYDSCAVIR